MHKNCLHSFPTFVVVYNKNYYSTVWKKTIILPGYMGLIMDVFHVSSTSSSTSLPLQYIHHTDHLPIQNNIPHVLIRSIVYQAFKSTCHWVENLLYGRYKLSVSSTDQGCANIAHKHTHFNGKKKLKIIHLLRLINE